MNSKSKQVAFCGITLYLFISGLILLFISPFLPWYYYGLNFLFPPNVSLIYLFEFGVGRVSSFVPLLTSTLILYLTGIAVAIIVAAVARKPVFFHGIITALFPVSVIFALDFQPYFPHLLIYGVSTALLGSVLLEASYFWYRRNAKTKVTAGTEVPKAEEQKSMT